MVLLETIGNILLLIVCWSWICF